MIKYLSEPQNVDMADDWFPIANLNHFWIKWRLDAFKKEFALLPKENSKVLEIGCGNGVFLKQLSNLNLNYEIDGCDLNLLAINQAIDQRHNLTIYDIHQRNIDLKDKYDAIFLLDVIEHIDDDNKFLESALFHLKPGGRVYINVPAYQWLYSKYDTEAGHKRRYSKKTLKDLTLKLNMKCIKIYSWGFALIPVAIIRKLILKNTTQDKIIRTGFKPPNKIVNLFLESLRKIEDYSFFHPLYDSLIS